MMEEKRQKRMDEMEAAGSGAMEEGTEERERMKERRQIYREILREFWADEEGIGVIELVLILVVLIGLVIIFKSQISQLLNNIFKQIESLSQSVY